MHLIPVGELIGYAAYWLGVGAAAMYVLIRLHAQRPAGRHHYGPRSEDATVILGPAPITTHDEYGMPETPHWLDAEPQTWIPLDRWFDEQEAWVRQVEQSITAPLAVTR